MPIGSPVARVTTLALASSVAVAGLALVVYSVAGSGDSGHNLHGRAAAVSPAAIAGSPTPIIAEPTDPLARLSSMAKAMSLSATATKPRVAGPLPGPKGSSTPVIGVINTRSSPFGRDKLEVSDLYQGWFAGTLYQVYAGTTSVGPNSTRSTRNGLANGEPGIGLRVEDPQTTRVTTIGIFPNANATGALSVVSAGQENVTLQDSSGRTFAFNPVSRSFSTI